jgi:succinate-semialdehyde dehydrogenase/glutarate-semialdehyde dehydrogenase
MVTGSPVAASSMRSVNPATEEEIARYAVHDAAAVDAALDRASARRPSWRATPIEARCRLMTAAGALLRERVDVLAGLITAEMGKPIAESRAEVEKCAFTCDWFAEHAPGFLADEPSPSDSPRSFVAFEPLGTVFAGMPWNFPLWQVFRFAAPGLCAGNGAVLKHASNVAGCALAIGSLFRDAGFPEGVFEVLLIPNDRVEAVIEDPRISAVTLTGSTAAGRSVAAAAGRSLKPAVLELGGSDAFIVLEDADLDEAAAVAARSRFQNAGQSCIAAKRFIVVDAVAEAFEDRLVAQAEAMVVGDPTRATVTMGPLARADLRETVERQLRDSVAMGAALRFGGTRPEGRGYFLTPAVLTGCTPEMPAFTEETFGPLAAVMRVGSAEEALVAANRSQFGLGGNIWTRDEERGVSLARRMESGGVFVNGMTHSDPRLPFGGVKDSGYGRELAAFGIREFVNIKTVWLPGAAAETSRDGAAVE